MVKGLEKLVRDISDNLIFARHKDAQYSEDGESVKEEFKNVGQQLRGV
jgi:hypothetical protein